MSFRRFAFQIASMVCFGVFSLPAARALVFTIFGRQPASSRQKRNLASSFLGSTTVGSSPVCSDLKIGALFFQVVKENEPVNQIASRGWGTVPITLIVVLALLCLLLIVHIVRSRFRGRLSPSEASYMSSPPQYYKCVPVYDTPVHRNEKIVPL